MESGGEEPRPAPPGRARRVGRDEVRRRILASAYGVFEVWGYEGASLERVAEAAGFSKGAVYSNFAGKDELFFELVSARIDERAAALVEAAAARDSGGRPGARGPRDSSGEAARLAGSLLRAMGEEDPAWQVLFIEFWLRCARNEDLRSRLAEKRRAMRSRIADSAQGLAAARGIELPPAAAMDLATTVLALSNGLGIEGLIDPASVRPALMGELLARIVAGYPA
jgi:AcrR family transcriptional regulator